MDNRTLSLVQRWRPQRNYRKEDEFKNALVDYLRKFGLGVDTRHEVEGEMADIVVNEQVCIEVGSDLDATAYRDLTEKVDLFIYHFSSIIAVIWRVEDEDAWRALVERYDGSGKGTGGGRRTPVYSVRKEPPK